MLSIIKRQDAELSCCLELHGGGLTHEPITKAGVKELSVSLPTGRLSGAAPQMTKAWPELLLPLKG